MNAPAATTLDGNTDMGSKSTSKNSLLSGRCRALRWRWLESHFLHKKCRRSQPRSERPRPAPPDTSPLARFVPKENLVFYCEFSGLDSHEAAWKNTACCKMLNDTTLGEMLGAVSEQLLEKLLSIIPNHRLNGGEIVTLIKHSAGFRLGRRRLNADPRPPMDTGGRSCSAEGPTKITRFQAVSWAGSWEREAEGRPQKRRPRSGHRAGRGPSSPGHG